VDRVDQAAAADRQPILLTKERRDFAERQAQLLVEDDRQCDRLRAELHTRGAERIGGLQRVPALHAPTTRAACPNLNPKLPHDDLRHREFFLILGRDPEPSERAATAGARGRQRRVMSLIDATGPSTPRFHPVASARFAARPLRIRTQRLRERRSLPPRGPASLIELPLQSLILAAQLIALALDPLKLTPQLLALDLRAFGTLAPLDLARVVIVMARLRHATFMADS
jgi:hypothetical protein